MTASTTILVWRQYPATALADDSVLSTAWDSLNAARGNLPFLAADAVAAAVEAFGNGSERLLVGCRSGEAAAMFVLAPQGRLRWSTFQPSQLPLGTWVAAAEESIDELAAALVRGPLGLCLALTVTQIDPLTAPRSDDRADCEHVDYIETAWIDVAGSFADYWNARGKNLRQNLRKQRNRLAAEGVRTSMRMLRALTDMAPALMRYGALESSGWKAEGGTAIHPNNVQGRFYRRLLEGAAARGEAVVCEYLFDERTVAMNLCLVRNGCWTVLKTTYDEALKTYSPASLLREEELRSFFIDGSTVRVEYFGRVMEWHTRLTDCKRTLYQLTAYRWPMVKTIAGLRRRGSLREAQTGEPATTAVAEQVA